MIKIQSELLFLQLKNKDDQMSRLFACFAKIDEILWLLQF